MSGLMRSSEQKNMRISAFRAISVSRRWRIFDFSHPSRYASRAGAPSIRNGRACRLAIEERLNAVSVARRAAVKDMPCDYGLVIATRRLRLLLRIWTVVFVLGAIDFFVFPYLTVRILNGTAK